MVQWCSCCVGSQPSLLLSILLVVCKTMYVCASVVHVDIWREAASVSIVRDAALVADAVLAQVEQSAAPRVVRRAHEERDSDARNRRDATDHAGTAATDDEHMSACSGPSLAAPGWPIVWPQPQPDSVLSCNGNIYGGQQSTILRPWVCSCWDNKCRRIFLHGLVKLCRHDNDHVQ